MNQRKKIYNSLIALGYINIDIISEVSKETLIKYNYNFEKKYFAKKDNNFILELEKNPQVKIVPGGSIQNTIRILKWVLNMNEKTKNNKISLLGLIGDDEKKNIIYNELNELKVNQIFEINKNSTCSKCGVGIYKNERYLLGASNGVISDTFVNNHLTEILNHNILLLEGFMIGRKFNLFKKLCLDFINNNNLIVFTLSANFIIDNYYNYVIEIGNYSDIIFSNNFEIESLAKENNKSLKENIEIVHRKLKEKNRLIITTCGENPVIISKYNYRKNKMEFILYSYPNQIKTENIVDTNGAGDAFLAGFLSDYMKGENIEKCCDIGNLISEIILKNIGCTFDKNKIINF